MGGFAAATLMPAASKVALDPVPVPLGAALALTPVPKHGFVLVVGLSDTEPRDPDESSVLPTGTPIPLILDGALGTLRGDVIPIAGAVGAI
jgi:hypothetical protein